MKLLFFLFFLSSGVQAYEFGTAVVGGKGCEKNAAFTFDSKSDQKLELPVKMSANKTAARAVERKSCTVRVPIKVGPKEKITVREINWPVEFDTESPARAFFEMSIFLKSPVGQKDTHQKFEGNGKKQGATVKLTEALGSGCGQEIMMGINLSGRLQGAGIASFATLPVRFTIRSESCP